MMQIREIVLYSWDGEKRTIPLHLNSVNIITGDSATGKTALSDIIDYCLGSSTCDVPRGRITDTVSWYGLLLQLDESQVFIARQAPEAKSAASQRVFLSEGVSVASPSFADLRPVTNVAGLISFLSRMLNLPNTEGAEMSELPSYVVTLRHAAFFLYQQQDEIISRQRLFHRQGEPFVSNSIRETLPFFLGAVGAQDVAAARRAAYLAKKVRAASKEVAELEAAADRGGTRARQLLAESAAAGLLTEPEDAVTQGVDALAHLRQIVRERETDISRAEVADTPLGQEDNARTALLRERRSIRSRYQLAQSSLESISTVQRDRRNLASEAAEQQARLSFIKLLPDSEQASCPLCGAVVEDHLPEVDELREHLAQLKHLPESLPADSGRLNDLQVSLKEEMEACQEALRVNSAQLAAVERANDRALALRLRESSQAAVLGKIEFYLEGISDGEVLRLAQERLEVLRRQLDAIQAEIDEDVIKDRTQSIISRLNATITAWSDRLALEYRGNPLRLDPKKLQVVVDSADGPLPMPQIGSGQNWVAYHLLVHLALHQWFSGHRRPVPNFVFFDQPSQVGFPADSEYDKNDPMTGDRTAIADTFRFIIDVLDASRGKFQVIIAEHADFSEDWFQDCVREKWRDGNALIPSHW